MKRNKHHVNANSGSSGNPQSDQTLFGHGVLYVEIFRAEDIKGDEMHGHGRADPFLKVHYGTVTNRVTLCSEHHQDGGSNPEWNTRFKFPLRNGGTPEHNILDIEIWNRNKFTSFRGDSYLGHVRIGNLASWIEQHPYRSTPAYWYPIFYKRPDKSSKDQMEELERGQILMKFYFLEVQPQVFAYGNHTEARLEKTESNSGLLATKPGYRVDGTILSSVLGVAGTVLAQTLIILFVA